MILLNQEQGLSFYLVTSLYLSVVFLSFLYIDLPHLILFLVSLSLCTIVKRIFSSAQFMTPLYMGMLCGHTNMYVLLMYI